MVIANPKAFEGRPCPGCGMRFHRVETPGHRYLGASPGCWAVYGHVLARDYQSPAFFAAHGLCVDTYAAQHPGEFSPQAAQSVAIHLAGLAMAAQGITPEKIAPMRRAFAKVKRFPWLSRPEIIGTITVVDVARARNAGEHVAAINRWSADVWEAWKPHHTQVRGWIAKYMPA